MKKRKKGFINSRRECEEEEEGGEGYRMKENGRRGSGWVSKAKRSEAMRSSGGNRRLLKV